jgi:hypothetical protein
MMSLGCSPFARHYLGNSSHLVSDLTPCGALPKTKDCNFFLLLCLLRCFTSAGAHSLSCDRVRFDSTSNQVSPFGYLRIKGCLPPPRSFSQAATSFVGFLCRGIHLYALNALIPLKHENVLEEGTVRTSCCWSLAQPYIPELLRAFRLARITRRLTLNLLISRFNCQRSGPLPSCSVALRRARQRRVWPHKWKTVRRMSSACASDGRFPLVGPNRLFV